MKYSRKIQARVMSTHFERTPLALAMMAAVALITSPSFANTNTTVPQNLLNLPSGTKTPE